VLGDDIAGFDVEMQVSAAVQVAQGRAEMLAEVAKVCGSQPLTAAVEDVGQGGAGEVFQDQ
jgi:hypothetical protein